MVGYVEKYCKSTNTWCKNALRSGDCFYENCTKETEQKDTVKSHSKTDSDKSCN